MDWVLYIVGIIAFIIFGTKWMYVVYRDKEAHIKEHQRQKIEAEIFDAHLLERDVSYTTKVKMSLVDMNVVSSVIIDVENGRYNHLIVWCQRMNIDAPDCALRIMNQY